MLAGARTRGARVRGVNVKTNMVFFMLSGANHWMGVARAVGGVWKGFFYAYTLHNDPNEVFCMFIDC